MMAIAPPLEGADDQFFWDGARRGELLLQQCGSCDTFRNPPSLRCGNCGSGDTRVATVSGRGTVCSWIVSQNPRDGAEAPRVAALIELEEGPRLVSNLVDVGPGDMQND